MGLGVLHKLRLTRRTVLRYPSAALMKLAIDELNNRDISDLGRFIRRKKIDNNIYRVHIGDIAELKIMVTPLFIYLYGFYVGSPGYSILQGRGIGTMMLDYVKRFARQIRRPIILDCESKNVTFYKKNGFEEEHASAVYIVKDKEERAITMIYRPRR